MLLKNRSRWVLGSAQFCSILRQKAGFLSVYLQTKVRRVPSGGFSKWGLLVGFFGLGNRQEATRLGPPFREIFKLRVVASLSTGPRSTFWGPLIMDNEDTSNRLARSGHVHFGQDFTDPGARC